MLSYQLLECSVYNLFVLFKYIQDLKKGISVFNNESSEFAEICSKKYTEPNCPCILISYSL